MKLIIIVFTLWSIQILANEYQSKLARIKNGKEFAPEPYKPAKQRMDNYNSSEKDDDFFTKAGVTKPFNIVRCDLSDIHASGPLKYKNDRRKKISQKCTSEDSNDVALKIKKYFVKQKWEVLYRKDFTYDKLDHHNFFVTKNSKSYEIKVHKRKYPWVIFNAGVKQPSDLIYYSVVTFLYGGINIDKIKEDSGYKKLSSNYSVQLDESVNKVYSIEPADP